MESQSGFQAKNQAKNVPIELPPRLWGYIGNVITLSYAMLANVLQDSMRICSLGGVWQLFRYFCRMQDKGTAYYSLL